MRSHPLLDRAEAHGVKLGLERMRQLLSALGEPQLAVPTLHVAGTNGKGSTCAYLTAALVDAGYRVGTYLSPHLEAINERVWIDGVPVDDATLSEALEAVDRVRVDWAARQGLGADALTWFEWMTAAALWIFAHRGVDLAVIEVGLGGRLDATNVVEPLVCGITSIGWDHMDVLGDTLGAIAWEKAGIIKPRASACVGPVTEEAALAIRRRADAVGAEVWWSGARGEPGQAGAVPVQLRRERRAQGWILTTPAGTVGPLALGMEGAHQGANAAVAVGMLHQLAAQGFAVPEAAVRSGLARARVGARVERLRPGLILDGAHNPEGTAALAAWLAEQPRPARRILLFGMGEGRDPRAILAPLLPHVDEVVLTCCDHPKSLAPLHLAHALGEVEVALSDGGPVRDVLPEVYAEADETVVAGSLYLAGAVRLLVSDGMLDGLAPGAGGADDEPDLG
jgi:dihydrofolate synthase/folylpolyglutamate synthase